MTWDKVERIGNDLYNDYWWMLNLIKFLILLGIQININQEKSEAVGLVWLDTQEGFD